MMASFHVMRRQLSARLRWLNCGQVGERGIHSFEAITHVLRPAEIQFGLLAEKSGSSGYRRNDRSVGNSS
jgi:hypothetical protein